MIGLAAAAVAAAATYWTKYGRVSLGRRHWPAGATSRLHRYEGRSCDTSDVREATATPPSRYPMVHASPQPGPPSGHVEKVSAGGDDRTRKRPARDHKSPNGQDSTGCDKSPSGIIGVLEHDAWETDDGVWSLGRKGTAPPPPNPQANHPPPLAPKRCTQYVVRYLSPAASRAGGEDSSQRPHTRGVMVWGRWSFGSDVISQGPPADA